MLHLLYDVLLFNLLYNFLLIWIQVQILKTLFFSSEKSLYLLFTLFIYFTLIGC